MKLKTSTTTYGQRIECPFCQEEYSFRGSMIGNIQRHIKNQAKNEALAVFVGDIIASESETPHLMYFKAHTSNKKIIFTNDRVFDDDLEVQE